MSYRLNPEKVRDLVATKAKYLSLTAKAVDPLVYCITSHWDMYKDFDWFWKSTSRFRLLENPSLTTTVLHLSLEEIKKDSRPYFEIQIETAPITKEISNEDPGRSADPPQPLPAPAVSAADPGRDRE